jgi:hypothetical protein
LDWKLIDNFDTGSRVFEDGVIEISPIRGAAGKLPKFTRNCRAGRAN